MERTWWVAVVLSLSLADEAIALPQENSTAQAAAESQQKEAPERDRLRNEQKAYFGKNVRIHRRDGTTTVGRLIGETAEGLAVQPSPSDEPVLVPYEEVESIATGMRRWQKIALGAGAAGAVLAVLAAQ